MTDTEMVREFTERTGIQIRHQYDPITAMTVIRAHGILENGRLFQYRKHVTGDILMADDFVKHYWLKNLLNEIEEAWKSYNEH